MEKPSSWATAIILIASTLTVMAGTIIAPVINLIKTEFGIGSTLAGFVIAAHALFVALLCPIAGKLIDAVGAKKPLMYALFLYGIAGGSGLLARSYPVLLASRVLLGAAIAVIFVSITVIIIDRYDNSERNKLMGWRVSSIGVGGIVWPVIGGFLGSIAWRLPFGIYMIGIPLGFTVMFGISNAKTSSGGRINNSNDSTLKIILRNPVIFFVFALIFLTTLLIFTIVIFVPQRVNELGVSNPFLISAFVSSMTAASAAASAFYAKIKTKLSYMSIALTALSLWTVAYNLIYFSESVFLIAPAAAVSGLGTGIVLPAAMVWVGEISEGPFSGRIIALLGTFAFLGQFSAPAIMGPLESVVGLRGIFLAAGGVSAVFLIGTFVFARLYSHHEKRIARKT